MTDWCPECKKWAQKGSKFCAACGRDLKECKKESNLHNFYHFLTLLAVVTVLGIVIINTMYCVANFTNISDESYSTIFGITISFGLEDVTLFKFHGLGMELYFVMLIVVDILCLAFALYRFLPVFKKEIETKNYGPTKNTGLGSASTYLAASLALSVIYFLIVGASGHSPDTEWMDEYSDLEMVFMLTRAGFREELMFRVFWIGLPMMIVALILHKDKRCWQYLFGGFGMTQTAFVLVVFSSILFGLGHNDGWGWTKIIDAAISGVIFGYLYVEFGLYAVILAHTANDVVSTVGLSPLGTVNESLMILALLGIGVVVLIHWLVKPRMNLIRVDKMERLPEKLNCNLLEQWKRH